MASRRARRAGMAGLLATLVLLVVLSIERTSTPVPPEVEDDRATAGGLAPVPTQARPDGTSPTAPTEPPSPKIPPPSPASGFVGSVRGRVVHFHTGEPVVGARVAYVVRGTDGGVTLGATTDRDGRFAYALEEALRPAAGGRFEIRVTAPGYWSWRGPPAALMDVDLVPRGAPRRPGRIRGRAVDASGRPLSGFLDVVLVDEEGTRSYRTALADADGAFVLSGIPAGAGSVRLDRVGEREEIWVVEGGEVVVELRARVSRESLAPPAWTEGMARETSALEARLARALHAAPRESARLAGVYDRLCVLKAARHAALPAREVVVTDLPEPESGSFALLTAEANGQRWVVEVEGGEARFPALTRGRWSLRLARPGRPESRRPVDVAAGDGPQTVRFVAPSPR